MAITTIENPMYEIQSCPICKNRAKLIKIGMFYRVVCSNNDCCAMGYTDLGQSGAIFYWNEYCKIHILISKIEELRREHDYCDEDSWYSCPLSVRGCSNENEAGMCTCGAEQHNQKIDELLNWIQDNYGDVL